MDPHLRSAFNADFSAEKYTALLRCVNEAVRWPADFRIAETPIFLTPEFTNEAMAAAEIALLGDVDRAEPVLGKAEEKEADFDQVVGAGPRLSVRVRDVFVLKLEISAHAGKIRPGLRVRKAFPCPTGPVLPNFERLRPNTGGAPASSA